MTENSIFRSLDQIATKGVTVSKKNKRTKPKPKPYIKKLSIDIDKTHLKIIEKRIKIGGLYCTQRAVIWEALELLAGKYGIQWQKGIHQ